MMRHCSDITILGSGFAGSLLAAVLQRVGRSTVVVDRARHPRFAIGESSTPVANMILRDLSTRYDLTMLTSLSRYGSWIESNPHLTCGRKRGFSYFKHQSGREFEFTRNHSNELLVAASRSDVLCDTHWYRPEVDTQFAEQALKCGAVLLDQTRITDLSSAKNGWLLRGRRDDEQIEITSRFLVDATGAAGVVPRALGIGQVPSHRTNSRAIYSHFTQVGSWDDWYESSGGDRADHPFPSDTAAQHHVLDGAWCWMLRFDNGITSVGLDIDASRFPLDTSESAEREWSSWLTRYPSLAALLEHARLAETPGRLIRTGRLQRQWHEFRGPGWVALPHTAGFIDPLHSTGIAHSLVGIDRLVRILEQHWERETLGDALTSYDSSVCRELDMIDRLVSGCFSTFRRFSTMVAFTMLYFAAATTYELQRVTGAGEELDLLCANDSEFHRIVQWAEGRLRARRPESEAESVLFAEELASRLAPFNQVGLFSPNTPNMYRYTAID